MKRNKKGQFTSEGMKGNDFAKGMKPNSTSFKKGENRMQNHNKWKGGIQRNKNDCTYLNNGDYTRSRRPRVVYQNHLGDIPKGYVIWHKDGDRSNDSIENLEAISRAEMMKRNAKNH